MQISQYISIIVLFIILYLLRRNQKLSVINNMKNKKAEDKTKMIELVKRFINSECIIGVFDDTHQYIGTIKEVSNGALLIERNGEMEAINLDYVIRIRQYPRTKKGKKKAIVADLT